MPLVPSTSPCCFTTSSQPPQCSTPAEVSCLASLFALDADFSHKVSSADSLTHRTLFFFFFAHKRTANSSTTAWHSQAFLRQPFRHSAESEFQTSAPLANSEQMERGPPLRSPRSPPEPRRLRQINQHRFNDDGLGDLFHPLYQGSNTYGVPTCVVVRVCVCVCVRCFHFQSFQSAPLRCSSK